MNKDIANILKGHLSSLTYVDRLAGLVVPFYYQKHSGGTKSVPTTYPVSCDITAEDCKDTQVLKDLVPDSKKRCIMYFEDDGCYYVETRGQYRVWESRLKLVCWLNAAKFTTSCSPTSLIIQDLIAQIPEQPQNQGNYMAVVSKVVSQARKDRGIFAGYSYDIYKMPMLTYPYDYFSLMITTRFMMNKDCPVELQTQEAICD